MNALAELTLDSEIIERAAVPLTYEAVESLCNHYLQRHPPKFSPLCLGWSMYATLGEDGYELWRDLMLEFDEYEPLETLPSTWATFAREPLCIWADRLLLDEMNAARWQGWQPPTELQAAFYRLAAEENSIDEAHKKSAQIREILAEELESLMSASVHPVPAMQPPPAPLPKLIQSSADFVTGFEPPEYLLDGVLQRRFFYSVTAQTGVGKTTVAMLLAAHVSVGRQLGTLDVAKGSVLYFAGENPTDIQMRWLGLTQELSIDPATADVHFIAGAMPLSLVADRITAEVVQKRLTLALVVVDTSAAYDESEDENSNSQAATHARRLRSLTTLPGGPCVVVLCHPTKRAADDDLIPRGGGAFLAEVDGNVALRKVESLVVLSAQGKFRGPEFTPLSFELKTVHHPRLKDVRGRDIPTVVAQPVSDAGKAQLEAAARRHEDMLLKAIETYPAASLRELAMALRWLDRSGKPLAEKVRRGAKTLENEKLVRKHRGAWQLTSAGEKELNRLDQDPARASLIR